MIIVGINSHKLGLHFILAVQQAFCSGNPEFGFAKKAFCLLA